MLKLLLLATAVLALPLIARGEATAPRAKAKKAAPVAADEPALTPLVPAKKAPPPPPPTAKQAPLLLPPSLPPPPPAANPSPPGYRTLEAQGPALAAPGGEEAQVTAEARTGADLRRIRVTPRLGILLPRTELSIGPLVGVEASYLFPVLGDRLRASLGVSYSLVTFQGARLVPGRGLDRALIQNSSLVPVELLGTYDLIRSEGGFGVSAGLGYGLYITSSEVLSLGKAQQERAVASALVLAARATRSLGPGALLLDVRHAELKADLGPLAGYSQGTFSGTSLALGYALDF